MSHPERIVGLNRAGAVDPTARLTILDAEKAPDSHIELGAGVFIGNRVELTACGGGSVIIDDDTSIQDSSIIAGDVKVGAHCLFGKYVFVASRGHNFRYRPEWLIRDQDAEALSRIPPEAALADSQVRIEDDCWIAQSVVISPGIYVGRGAVIGANCVVTHDVGPYEVHGGVPNRKLGTRLDFVPPWALDARDDAALPYFYRGFGVTRAALAASRRDGIVAARTKVRLVLAKARAKTPLRIVGLRSDKAGELRLKVTINGVASGDHPIAPGPFVIELPLPAATPSVGPAPLDDFTAVDIEAAGAQPRYGIATASLSVSP